jgi:hypothetical protein
MHLMRGGPASQASVRERDEIVGPADHLAARLRGVAVKVVGEDPAPRLPVLGVEVSAVAGLQLLDRLDLEHGRGVIHSGRVTL